jgi:hypothetical protein
MICDFSYDLQNATFNGNLTQRALALQFLRTNMEWAEATASANNSAYWGQVRCDMLSEFPPVGCVTSAWARLRPRFPS